MINRYALGSLALLAAAAFALSACAPDNPTGTSSASVSGSGTPAAITLVKPGTLTVCTNPPYQPMEFDDGTGQIVGFDIDMMQLVADKLGVDLSVIDADFSQITSGAVFAAKKCDLGASALTITPARSQATLFSIPYFDATQVLVVNTDSGITDLTGLSGKTVAVQTDTTGDDYANQYASQDGYSVMVFDDGGTALNSLLSGRAQAVIIDRAVAYSFVAANSTTTVTKEFSTGEQYGFSAEINDPNATALIGVVNDVLTTANSDGTYLSLYKKWVDPNATSASLPTASPTPADITSATPSA